LGDPHAPDARRLGTFEFAVATTDPGVRTVQGVGAVDLSKLLRVRYQLIDAPRSGHYGFGVRRPGAAFPSPGTREPDPAFSDVAADDTPALWEQVANPLSGLAWQPITEDGKPVGLRAIVPEEQIYQILNHAGRGRAIEFFIGAEVDAGEDQP